MICTEEDDFVKDKFEQETRWIADLSNGLRVYQDDHRAGPEDKAWLRLKEYCFQNKVLIDRLKLQFRSHVEDIEKAEGYYFSKGLGVYVGNPTWNFYIVGRLVGDKLYKTWWRTPELQVEETRIEEVSEVLKTELGKCIIRNDNAYS